MLSQGTPLHLAVDWGTEGVVRQLVRAGANINARTYSFETHRECAIINGHEGVFRCPIEEGASVNGQARAGQTLPHLAKSLGSPQMVRLLLKAHMQKQRRHPERRCMILQIGGYRRLTGLV